MIVGEILRGELRAAARTELDSPAGTAEAVLHEVAVMKWHDLYNALRNGTGAGGWSIGAEAAAGRLVRIMRVIGPTSISDVLYPAIHVGLYDAVLAAARMTCPDDAETVRRVREQAQRYMDDQRVGR